VSTDKQFASQTLEPLRLESGIRERYLENINGLRVHILESGFETPNRPALLLLHGFPDLAFCWRRVMLPLAAAGYHVIAPDQRGYGRTAGWDGRYDGDVASFRNHSYARDAIGITMALGHREVACVVGHDVGAAVATYCALARPDYFRSLILMSPFGGVPALPFGTEEKLQEQQPSQARQLAALNPPRKDSYAYFSTPSANNDMLHAKQGVSEFLRAYFFLKSADNRDNRPHPLLSASATELAKLPTYYIMDLSETMATTVAPLMPTKEQVANERWLPAYELEVYASEWERTGFQGALNWYRCHTDGTNRAELELFAGRTIDVPACFIAGEADWGIYRQPGAFEAMQTKAFTHMGKPHIVQGAGHWVQQERPKETSEHILAFLKTAFASVAK
jgi:pimeloyl-ACP methyl ester carboxylesterase